MAVTNLPFNLFKLATLRAAKKPVAAHASARRVPYTLSSALHAQLVADRAGSDPRAAMKASASSFIATDSLRINDALALRALFPGFEHIDDYLRTEQKSAVKAGLKALIEGPAVLNQAASAYVAGWGISR